MKTKELQAFKGLFWLRLFCVLLLLLSFAGALPISAQEASDANTIINENYNLIRQYSLLLDEDIATYSELDSTPTKDISKSVALVINEYRSKLHALQSHADAGSRLLSAEISLAYTKGQAAGELAWIYYYNIIEINNASSSAVLKGYYEELCKVIDTETDASVLNTKSDVINSDMNRAVYTEKIKGLALDSDSLQASSCIAGAVDSLAYIESPDLFGENFQGTLANVKAELLLQRSRDSLTEQIKEIFTMICPGESFKDNSAVALFTYKMKNALNVSDMNEAMRAALCELTAAPEDQGYLYIFANELQLSVSETALKATKNSVAGDFTPLFKGYTLKREKACTKDSIVEILFAESNTGDEELKSIEAFFNSESGKIDACASKAELDAELIRAEHKKQLHSATKEAREQLAIVLGNYDTTLFTQRITTVYEGSITELDMLSSAVKDYEANCNSSLQKAKAAIKIILNEAKAERFLLDHKTIIKKPKEQLTSADELPLKTALNDYVSLETEVRKTLASQISSVAEKYKSVLANKMRGLCNDDAFYLDLCEIICDELNQLSTENIDVFYNNCDLIFKKSQALQAIVLYYRGVTADEIYQSFTAEEKEELATACRQATDAIGKADISNSSALEAALSEIAEEAKLSIDRTSQYARPRITAKSSKNIEIQKILSDVKTKIIASRSKSEMISYADAAIFKINRLLTIDEMTLRASKLEYTLNEMKFLTADEKVIFSGQIKSLSASLTDEARLAENITVLSFIWDNFSESLEEISNEANGKDLERGRTNYISLIDKEVSSLETELRGMVHLTSERCEEFLNSIISLCAKFKTDIASCKTSGEVAEAYASSLEQLHSVKLSASIENLGNYKAIISGELDKLGNVKDRYSDENYNNILSIIEKKKTVLSSCADIAECSALLEGAKAEILLVNDLLDDAKEAAIASLDKLLAECTGEPLLYSSENIASIRAIYSEAIKSIRSFEAISDVSALNAALSDSLSAIKLIPRDLLYSSDKAVGITTAGTRYPLGHNASKGLWASVYSPGGIAYGATLSVFPVSIDKNVGELQRIIRNAAKKNTLAVKGDPSEQQLKMLKKCVVSMALDIDLSKPTGKASYYTLNILLPSDVSEENILGIAFIDSNNNVEFYSIERSDFLISLNLSHFSRYYIVSENTTDLTPLIIFLLILLLFEIVALCFFIFLRRNRKRKENDMLPDSFMYSVNPFLIYSALRVRPENGVELALLLSIAALALGCGIALLARVELKALKKQRKESAEPQVTPEPEQKRLEQREALLLKERTYLLEEKKEEPVLCSVSVDTDSAEADIQAFIYSEDIPDEYAEESESSFALHRAEINLDVIAAKFKDGDLVTLDALKRKRLVGKKTDYVKILARGSLTKPLIIEAHDFSRAAEEMLKAVGGEAIRIR